MIKLEQISAENQDALSDEQIFVLENLVKNYPAYANAVGRWPSLHTKLVAEQNTPTVKTKGLKAVLTALDDLPEVVVESSGTDKSQSYFESRANWNALAQDVLNMLFELPITLGQQSFVLVQRRVEDLVLRDDSILRQDKTGRRF